MPTVQGSARADSNAVAVYTREPADPRVTVVDGYGVSITVERGHLVIRDGVGRQRRVRRYSRIERTLRRIIVMSQRGHITLDAYRWCTDLGVAVVQLDRAGNTVASTVGSHDDARLVRAQAVTGEGGPHAETGLLIVKNILGLKLSGQASIAEEILGNRVAASIIREHADRVEKCTSIKSARTLESHAASTYWDAWSGMPLPWRPSDLSAIPAHWRAFRSRGSNETPERNRNATHPANAILNYAYRLAEVECTLAIRAVGLDPTLGYLHLDEPSRDSLALDVIEIVRPAVDRYVLELLSSIPPVRYLSPKWFTELSDGQCRLVAPLTHMISEQIPQWSRVVAPHVDQMARILSTVGKGDVKPATRLTGSTMARSKPRGVRGLRKAQITGVPTVESIIPDELWEKVSPMLPPKPPRTHGGRKWADDRMVLAGIVCVEILGSSWAQIPATLGTNRWTCSARLDLLKQAGAWDSIRRVIAESDHLAEMVS